MNWLTDPNYDPNALFDKVMSMYGFKTNRELADAIGADQSQICTMRTKAVRVSSGMLLRLHDLTGLPAKELRRMMGVEQ